MDFIKGNGVGTGLTIHQNGIALNMRLGASTILAKANLTAIISLSTILGH